MSVHHSSGIPRRKSFIQPDVNPFVHTVNLTVLQKCQVALMSVTLAPIRIVAVFVTFLFTWLIGCLVTLGVQIGDKNPVGHIRLALFQSLRVLGRLILFIVGFHWINVKGTRVAVDKAPILVVAPHSSMFDVLISFVYGPSSSGVSRAENFSIFGIGTLLKAFQPVLVSRTDPDSRQKTVQEICRRSVEMKGHWPQIVIYPEGTCTNRKSLITFKSGAFIPGVPVQPVVLQYLNKVDTYSWTWNGPSGLTLLWLTLCQWNNSVQVQFLPVYQPNIEEQQNPSLFANNVRMLMADILDLPCTDHTFEDCRLMREAENLNMPMETGLIEFTKLNRKLGMNLDALKGRLQEFSMLAQQQPDKMLNIDNFAKSLNVPVTEALEDLFKLYDRNESGLIDFREYVIGLSLVSKPAVTSETVQLAFKVFDTDGDGFISAQEFIKVMSATFGDDFNGKKIFNEITRINPERVSYEEFYDFAIQRPEYAKLFVWYYDMQQDEFVKKQEDEEPNASGSVLTYRQHSKLKTVDQ
ncbi:lysophosphatidylcholine acyltransferase 2 [Ciona intestinalis]